MGYSPISAESGWQLEQHDERWRVQLELEQPAHEFEQQHWVPLRSTSHFPLEVAFLRDSFQATEVKGNVSLPQGKK